MPVIPSETIISTPPAAFVGNASITNVGSDISSLKANVSDMRTIILSMLNECNISARALHLDEVFVQQCLDDAASLGCPMEDKPGVPSFHKSNAGGAAIAFFAYSHLENEDVKTFIATYTSITIYIEDIYGEKPEIMKDFNMRFVTGSPQKTPVLEAFAQHLRRLPVYFNEMQTNGILIGTFKWVTSLWYEHGGTDTSLRPCQAVARGDARQSCELVDCDCHFPTYVRSMSGNGEPYVMFMFPRDMDFKIYAQAIPSLAQAINYFNDLLSLYKEEINGEEFNYISIMARHRSTTKIEVLRHLADRILVWHSATKNVLSGCRPAYDAFMRFSQGYVDYHTSASRYKLKELMGDAWSSD